MVRAVSSVLGDHVTVQGCFYHLTQSTWRKVQALGDAMYIVFLYVIII